MASTGKIESCRKEKERGREEGGVRGEERKAKASRGRRKGRLSTGVMGTPEHTLAHNHTRNSTQAHERTDRRADRHTSTQTHEHTSTRAHDDKQTVLVQCQQARSYAFIIRIAVLGGESWGCSGDRQRRTGSDAHTRLVKQGSSSPYRTCSGTARILFRDSRMREPARWHKSTSDLGAS